VSSRILSEKDKPKEDYTDTQIKEFNRKFRRGEKPREDLRTYTLPSVDEGGSADEADAKLNSLDNDVSASLHFLASRLGPKD